MATIEGVVASAECSDDHCVLTIFPIVDRPDPRVSPEGALDLTLERQPWQTRESHRDHARHIVGRRGVIEYDERNTIAVIRH